MLRGWMESSGPCTASALAATAGVSIAKRSRSRWRSSKRKAKCCAAGSLAHRPMAEIEWCNRRVLARIHRMTLGDCGERSSR